MLSRLAAHAGLVSALTAAAACILYSPPARADEMDLALERLVPGGDGQRCAQTLQDPPVLRDPDTGEPMLQPDQERWAALMAELSFATAPSLLQPAASGGARGTEVALGQAVTGIRDDSVYWRRGSRGRGARDCSGENAAVRRVLSRSELRWLKGLPYGFSLGASAGKLWRTGLWTFGGELKLALVEGYRRLPVPDLALRVAANTVVGDPQYELTNVAAAALVSKPFVAASLLRVTPYLAYQVGVGIARSGSVDLTPGTDAFALCAAPGPESSPQQSCTGSDADFAHHVRFSRQTLVRHQLSVGLRLSYRVLTLTAEALVDAVPVSRSTPEVPSQVARQWSVAVAPGLRF